MRSTPTRVLILAAVATLALPSTRLTARSAPEGTKSFYVSVLDESGKPVKDMAPEEFAMREDGRDVQIVSVGPAQAPLMVVFPVLLNVAAVRWNASPFVPVRLKSRLSRPLPPSLKVPE